MNSTFVDRLSPYLFKWYSIVFTVGGSVAALAIAKEYWWIAALVIIAALGGSWSFAYHVDQKLQTAIVQQKEHVDQFAATEESLRTSLQEAEQRLAAIPFELVARMQEAIATYSHDQLSKMLLTHAEFVSRMKKFTDTNAKDFDLRTFTKQASDLFVVAKVKPKASEHLKVGDPFTLFRKTSAGLTIESAKLVVHQPPDQAKGLVWFRIASYLTNDLGAIDRLADSANVEGIKGFGIEVPFDLLRYPSYDLRAVQMVVALMIEDISGRGRT